MLAKAAVEGKLATRADATKHQGDYRKIVEGVNDTLDAVIGPLNVAANYVDQISKGDIPAKITDTYNGDFNTIKNNLNTCIDAVNALVADAGVLAKAAVEGELATRADATKHQGDYRKIVEGVNETLDAVIGPLNVAANYVDQIAKGDIPAKITDTYNGDFNAIKNNLNTCIDAVNALVADAGALAKAAVEGKLGDARGCHQAPGRLSQDRRGRERDARCGDRAVERGGELCRSDLQGSDPGEDHRHLQWRFQHDQEQPEHLHRRGRQPCQRRRFSLQGDRRWQSCRRRRCDPASRRLQQDHRRVRESLRRPQQHFLLRSSTRSSRSGSRPSN